MLVEAQLLKNGGRRLRTQPPPMKAFMFIEDGVMGLYDVKGKGRLLAPRMRVVRHDVGEVDQKVMGFIVVHHDVVNPDLQGDQIVYCEWRVKPIWETAYARTPELPKHTG